MRDRRSLPVQIAQPKHIPHARAEYAHNSPLELGIRAQRDALPGVQDKVSAAMINLPVARAGERHILK
ncbi:MAG: hypothetical protein ACRDWT_19630, partial [Jatrophihabitantaceae bacterium]